MSHALPHRRRLGPKVTLGVFGDELNCITHGGNLLCLFIRYLDIKLIFQLHDQFNQIQAVRIQIFLKGCPLDNLRFFNSQLLHHNVPYLAQNLIVAHLHSFLFTRALESEYDIVATAGSNVTYVSVTYPFSTYTPDPLMRAISSSTRPTTFCLAAAAANSNAFLMARHVELPWHITINPRTPRRYVPPYSSGSKESRRLTKAGFNRNPPTLERVSLTDACLTR